MEFSNLRQLVPGVASLDAETSGQLALIAALAKLPWFPACLSKLELRDAMVSNFGAESQIHAVTPDTVCYLPVSVLVSPGPFLEKVQAWVAENPNRVKEGGKK